MVSNSFFYFSSQFFLKKKKIETTELIEALKLRLSDTNRNLAALASKVTGLLAVAMGPSFERHSKTILPPLLKGYYFIIKKFFLMIIFFLKKKI